MTQTNPLELSKRAIAIVLLLLLIPIVYADHEEEENEDGCSLSNLGSCLVDAISSFISKILNAPLQPLVTLNKWLLSEPIKIDIFYSLWALMLYAISIFYGLLFLYAGFNFIISGHDVLRRETAKTWFRNLLIMIIVVQASYLLYQVILEIASGLTAGVIGLIDPNFFLLTFDNILNIFLEIILLIPYILVLLLTAVILLIRYAIVASGVALFPIGLFLYFIEPLRAWGRAILSFLGVNIFVSFFASIALLIFSKLTDIGAFGYFKIVLMISAFLVVDFLFVYFLFFGVVRAAIRTTSSVISKVKGLM
jgi:hypothetical protein